jgi:hypothetical protein
MFKLNQDVLFLIFKELKLGESHNNNNSFHLVNKTWCEIIIPILWKNPWKWMSKEKMKSQFNVIIAHLSHETIENLRNQDISLPATLQKPLFNYISFCRYLSLFRLDKLCEIIDNSDESKISIVRNEILKLFIKSTKITHLYASTRFNYQVHLIPGAEHCFSQLELFVYNIDAYAEYDDLEGLEGLAKICKSIIWI